MGDARQAAEALLFEGAEEVFLYGSVSRGDATARSDIDLVALFADIDYGERYELTRRLEKAASEAIARRWPVQVFATDRPEWKARVEKVPSSFEHRINALGLVAMGESSFRGKVRWDKAMVRAMSDREEALSLFKREVLVSLAKLQLATSAGVKELSSVVSPKKREEARLNRMISVCETASITVEVTLKALAILYSSPTLPGSDRLAAGHNISACLDLLPQTQRSELADCLNARNINLAVMSSWRVKATYPDDLPVVWETADQLAVDYAAVAVEVTRILLAGLRAVIEPENDLLQEVVEDWETDVSFIACQDIRTGKTRSRDLDLDL